MEPDSSWTIHNAIADSGVRQGVTFNYSPKERDRYKEALEHIVKHLELTLGSMAPVSSVWIIATKALSK